MCKCLLLFDSFCLASAVLSYRMILHHDIVFASCIILKSVPRTCIRFQFSKSNSVILEKYDVNDVHVLNWGSKLNVCPVTLFSSYEYRYSSLFPFFTPQSLKTLKHPSILKFLAYIKNSDEKWVITERVLPLETVIDKLSPTEICAGLYSVVEALAFLNDRVSFCHFRGRGGRWWGGGIFLSNPLHIFCQFVAICLFWGFLWHFSAYRSALCHGH